MKDRSVFLFVIVSLLLSSCTPFFPPTVATPTPDNSLLEFSTLPPNLATPNPAVKAVTASSLTPLPPPSIASHNKPGKFPYRSYSTLPRYDPKSTNGIRVDIRSVNLSMLDLTSNLVDLLYSSFDSKTKWPAVDKMPVGFDPGKVMETGKNPGLGMQFLHKNGITGRGIGIAIIDETLLVDHIEYGKQVQVYEEDIENGDIGDWSMHGPAVASIAVGKNVGVAPEADLYYIASNFCLKNGKTDFTCLARDVWRIIEINQGLPANRRIRVLSMSIGWSPEDLGYEEITAAVNEARAAGLFVISSSLYETYGFSFHGLGHNPLSDMDDFNSFGPGSWWKSQFYEYGPFKQTLMVPMDARTTASPTGLEDYVYYGEGGWSWSIPYIAATYALACQVKADITPEEFWAAALKTGRTIQVEHGGKSYSFGVILDPQALIAALEK
jgi:hypothetical protein